MKKKYKTDCITGYPLRTGWNLHHMDLNEQNYTDITKEDNFCCLNKMTHEIVHDIYRYYQKDEQVLDRLKTVLDKMKKLNGVKNGS